MTLPFATTWARPRYGMCFAPDGRWAVALSRSPHARARIEIWRQEAAGWSPVTTGVPADVGDQLLALPGGTVLVRTRDGAGHRLAAVEPGASRAVTAARMPEPTVRMLPAAPGDSRTRCVVLGYDGEVTRLYRLTRAHRLVRCPVELKGHTEGGVWLDGRRLAVNHVRSRASSAIVVDTVTGETRTLLHVGPDTEDRVELYSPRSTLLVVRTDAGGMERIGFAHLGEDEPFWFPAETAAEGGITPLALDPAGRRLLLHEQRGVHSRLAAYDVAGRTRGTVGTPPGRLRGPAVWTGDGIVVPWSAPTAPHAMLRLLPGRPSLVPEPAPGTHPARVVTVEGAAGPLEAIVYGESDWMHAPRLVVALHGGPLSSWRYEYQPLFGWLADAGISVLALNQRGGTDYGIEHLRPIRGGWGGPDLDDVTAVLRTLAVRRGDAGAPAVFGQSYGAFLALLAACAVPDHVRSCVALAPFRSAASLYAGGFDPVRRLIDRLDGLREITDELGPRDVSRLADRIVAPTLLIHGDRDEVIPVHESRSLHARLIAVGRRPGADLTYLEVPGGGHDPLSEPVAETVLAAVRDFLTN